MLRQAYRLCAGHLATPHAVGPRVQLHVHDWRGGLTSCQTAASSSWESRVARRWVQTLRFDRTLAATCSDVMPTPAPPEPQRLR